jgi:hypothetical protein
MAGLQTHRKYSLEDIHVRGDYMICPDRHVVMICFECGSWIDAGKVHRITSEEPLHLFPSMVCPMNGCHYFV